MPTRRDRSIARRRSVARGGLSLVLALAIGGIGSPASAGDPPPAVRAVTVAELDQPVGFTFTPRGRIVYLERATGRVRLLDPSSGRDRTWFRISGVNSDAERGALGVALHPRWPRKPWVYVYVTRAPAGKELRNQLLRARIHNGRAVAIDVLLNSPIGSRTNHNGGRIAFGPDRKLYVVIGDGGEDPGTAQQLGNVRGKILRLNPNGSAPATNPFGSRVWSWGHRNSFGFAFDPDGGRLWESENGPECNDEINLIEVGGNYGWGPSQDCPNTNEDGDDPILPKHTFDATVAVTGMAFCDRCKLGAAYQGALLAGCSNGTCKTTVGPVMFATLTPDRDDLFGPPQRVPLVGHDGPVYSMEVAPGGRISFSDGRGIHRLVRA
jgi:glucose/arabinose dehydrogenase